MEVRVDGRAWMPKSGLTLDQQYNIKAALTIQPRSTSEHDDKEPDPIHLFVDREDSIGVPISFYLENRTARSVTRDLTTLGQPLRQSFFDAGVMWEDSHEWAEQIAARDVTIAEMTKNGFGGGIIQAGCAFGKTITALRIIHKLRVKTLVIVNRGFFTTQWTERIQEMLPGASIGIIQQDRCEYEDCDIVIGMVHSLAGRRYDLEMYRAFGLIVTDECHRISAPTWADVIPQFHAKYRLGLSATPRRKDGAQDVFFRHIGPVVFKAKTEAETPQIKRVASQVSLQDVSYGFGHVTPAHMLTTSQMEKQLSDDEIRNIRYADMVVKAVSAGRKPFVVSKFTEHLWDFEQLLRVRLEKAGLGDTTIDWVTGQRFVLRKPVLDDSGDQVSRVVMVKQKVNGPDGKPVQIGGRFQWETVPELDARGEPVTELVWEETNQLDGERWKIRRKVGKRYEWVWKSRNTSEEQLKLAESAQVILATQQMIEEGFDVQSLDLLVPLIPPTDIEQMAGRVRRRCKPRESKCQRLCPWRAGKCDGKKPPIILEPVDLGVQRFENRHNKRMAFYKSIGALE